MPRDAASSPVAPTRSPSDAAPPAGVRRRPRPIFLVIGVGLALALTAGLFAGIIATRTTGLVGSRVPTFSLPRVGGAGKVGVPADGGGGGHPAILLFFASWCGPCKQEIPALSNIYDRQRADRSALAKVAVIGVDGSDPTQDALAFMRSSKVSFPVGADAVYTVTSGKFGFANLPEAVFVTGGGEVAGFHLGGLSTAQFVSWEHRLLATG